MTYIPRLCLAVALAGSAFGQSAVAQTATTSFDVTITLQNACIIVSASDLDFGGVSVLTQTTYAQSSIVVDCTEGDAFTIALDAGQGGGDTASRVMTNAGNTVSYQLYKDAGYSTVWGVNTEALSATGTGDNQTFPVYGRVPIQSTPPAATYTDTIGVLITY